MVSLTESTSTAIFNLIASPKVVVARSGPDFLPFSRPNFAHPLRAATVGETRVVTSVRLILRTVLIFFSPVSSHLYSTIVLIPVTGSIFSVDGGNSSSSITTTSNVVDLIYVSFGWFDDELTTTRRS
ncbi:hypothetical protein PGTUg99_013502 [Puccinia graminis f. sp. tritici]|uniref:Uncharacterized protein n=1 Tax=Puccinia graminis f. sp. tritici TaxID=56615 RepID=A0A5B0M5V6_PUCGR|nr:hypothetical protein PGTUg99_013502 [Puccinia graminis f. sp. tritici]